MINLLTTGSDNKLLVNSDEVVIEVKKEITPQSMISTASDNSLILSSQGKLYVPKPLSNLRYTTSTYTIPSGTNVPAGQWTVVGGTINLGSTPSGGKYAFSIVENDEAFYPGGLDNIIVQFIKRTSGSGNYGAFMLWGLTAHTSSSDITVTLRHYWAFD
ncbi:MAG: hypothetical protein FWF56_03530 [Firmicutes bacterium]|nr:hypothetical protein [Bacillota bacterium]